jgi:hypothetical protein
MRATATAAHKPSAASTGRPVPGPAGDLSRRKRAFVPPATAWASSGRRIRNGTGSHKFAGRDLQKWAREQAGMALK